MPLPAFRLRFIAGLIAVIAGQRCLVGQPVAVAPATFDESVRTPDGSTVRGGDPYVDEDVIIGGAVRDGRYVALAQTIKGWRTAMGGDSAGLLYATTFTEGSAVGGVVARGAISWSLVVTPLASGIPADLMAPVILDGIGYGKLKTGKPTTLPGLLSVPGEAEIVAGVTSNILPGAYSERKFLQTLSSEVPKQENISLLFFRLVQMPQNVEIRFEKTLLVRSSNEGGAYAKFDPQFYIDPVATFELNGQTVRFADVFQLNASTNLFDPLRRPTIDLIDSWRYLDNGSNQGVEWRAADFNDAAWPLGQTALGFGEGDEATEVDFGGDMSNKHVTTYFRKEFESELSQAQLQSLELELVRDDGIAVYLNGVEIYRDNLADEALFDTLADGEVEDESEFVPQLLTIDMASLPAGTWRVGRNVLAAEVHLASPSDEDMRFALSMAARLVPEPPGIVVAALALVAIGCLRRRMP
jgi:hypothetical protein